MLWRGVLEQLGQLQRVLADLLHGRQQEAVQRDVDHLLEQPAGLEEVAVAALLHQARQLRAGARVVVAVLRVDGEALLLGRAWSRVSSGALGPESAENTSLPTPIPHRGACSTDSSLWEAVEGRLQRTQHLPSPKPAPSKDPQRV